MKFVESKDSGHGGVFAQQRDRVAFERERWAARVLADQTLDFRQIGVAFFLSLTARVELLAER